MTQPDESRVCRDCQQTLPMTMFSVAAPNGRLRPECKRCKSSRERASYAARRLAEGPPPAAKPCTACGATKALDSFKKRVDGKWGLSSECRDCLNARERARLRTSEQSRETRRQWAQNNREKVRAYARRSQKKHMARHVAYMREYRVLHWDKLVEAAHRAYVQQKPLIAERHRKWREENKHAVAAHARNYRALKRGVGGKHGKKDVDLLLVQQRGRCAACEVKLQAFHVDHVTPIARGGRNDRANLQLLCPTCNRRKGKKDPTDFMRLMGKLL